MLFWTSAKVHSVFSADPLFTITFAVCCLYRVGTNEMVWEGLLVGLTALCCFFCSQYIFSS